MRSATDAVHVLGTHEKVAGYQVSQSF